MPETLKISLKDVKSKKIPKNINLDDHVEIPSKYIKFLKKCWIKYTDRHSLLSSQGGFLISCDKNNIILRNIKQEIFELAFTDYIFYCKKDLEQYRSILEFSLENQKLDKKIESFNRERVQFLEQKKNFFLKYNIK